MLESWRCRLIEVERHREEVIRETFQMMMKILNWKPFHRREKELREDFENDCDTAVDSDLVPTSEFDGVSTIERV